MTYARMLICLLDKYETSVWFLNVFRNELLQHFVALAWEWGK